MDPLRLSEGAAASIVSGSLCELELAKVLEERLLGTKRIERTDEDLISALETRAHLDNIESTESEKFWNVLKFIRSQKTNAFLSTIDNKYGLLP